ncbi:hypothetical protein MKZ38_002050 [Zalerion maritima]|uniref:Uncharacterized protein n=1 Tax=Zalerion maritima TaxID=339359 RepID=A0AAD5WVF6_9PEZI|nr:hypothetical protein MKZ38_002050 [Zalerion maritima]
MVAAFPIVSRSVSRIRDQVKRPTIISLRFARANSAGLCCDISVLSANGGKSLAKLEFPNPESKPLSHCSQCFTPHKGSAASLTDWHGKRNLKNDELGPYCGVLHSNVVLMLLDLIFSVGDSRIVLRSSNPGNVTTYCTYLFCAILRVPRQTDGFGELPLADDGMVHTYMLDVNASHCTQSLEGGSKNQPLWAKTAYTADQAWQAREGRNVRLVGEAVGKAVGEAAWNLAA